MSLFSCPLLPEFDAQNWDSIEEVFALVPSVALRQHWRTAPEALFLPATAQFGWRDSTLFLFGVLQDQDIFNTADGLNQETWMLGDVLELFLRPPHDETYFEFHITPENQRLQLRLPDAKAISSGRDWREFHVSNSLFTGRTQVDATRQTWRVLMAVDLRALLQMEFAFPTPPWKVSVCRYDWTRGLEEPVISSSSPHQSANFHRQHEWGELVFSS